jgi:hypothetical protein
MLKKAYAERVVATDGGWVALDATDLGLIESVYKKNIREGEERLMLAVLESAVEDFQRFVLARSTAGKKLFLQAEEWFLDTDSEEAFSFRSICETLGLHPDHIRKGLIVWKEAKLKIGSADSQRADRSKLARARVKRPTITLSKTA